MWAGRGLRAVKAEARARAPRGRSQGRRAGNVTSSMAGAEHVQHEVARRGGGPDFVGRLAERLGASVRSTSAFGEPVERDGVTVIPVSRVAWGFGGGGSIGDAQGGSGGGGGNLVTPLGYIEVRDDGTEFKPLRDPRRELVAAVLAAGAVVTLLLRSRRV